MRPRAHGWGLGSRLFAAQAVALAAGAVTAAAVAVVIGPPLFHAHLMEASRPTAVTDMAHIEEAFVDAGLVSLGVGLVIALLLALGVSWYVTRRIRTPLDHLTAAAVQMSRGDYTARVDAAGAGPELATLGETFNAMAGRLDSIEVTRRRLLSDVAHEMRTPLATLNAHLEALEDGVTAWDDDTRHVLEDQAERLTRLARDLDEVSRAEEGRIPLELVESGLAPLVRSAAEALAPRFATKGVALEVDLADGPVTVDAQRVGQLLTNLLTNALRHTPPGGRVRVTSAVGRDAVVEVTDDGDGMTAEQLGHCFERFYRGDTARDREHGGSGIGLTIARAFAEAHGGSLTASSPGPGAGSTFRLRLPVERP